MFYLIFILGPIVLVTELMARLCSTIVLTFLLLALMNQNGAKWLEISLCHLFYYCMDQ